MSDFKRSREMTQVTKELKKQDINSMSPRILSHITVDEVYNSRNVVEENIQSVPRSVYLSSHYGKMNLGRVRDMLRMSKFEHATSFKPHLNSKDGRRYYRGVLPPGRNQLQ
jgi:hypothetical protein